MNIGRRKRHFRKLYMWKCIQEEKSLLQFGHHVDVAVKLALRESHRVRIGAPRLLSFVWCFCVICQRHRASLYIHLECLERVLQTFEVSKWREHGKWEAFVSGFSCFSYPSQAGLLHSLNLTSVLAFCRFVHVCLCNTYIGFISNRSYFHFHM